MCCMNYKGKEVEGCELKLNRLTAHKKQRKVRWSPLSETGQESDSMFATISAQLKKRKKKKSYFIYFRRSCTMSAYRRIQPTLSAFNGAEDTFPFVGVSFSLWDVIVSVAIAAR